MGQITTIPALIFITREHWAILVNASECCKPSFIRKRFIRDKIVSRIWNAANISVSSILNVHMKLDKETGLSRM